MTELTWEAPGPGTWFWDGGHGATPVGPAVRELFADAMRAGFESFTPDYGLPISHVAIRYVNGYPYSSVQFANLGERAVPPPVAAEQALESKRWRDELRHWHEDVRPDLVDTRLRLQSVDLGALNDSELAGHLDECAEEFTRGVTAHFALLGATVIPVGDFLAHGGKWGLPLDESLALLVGQHPLTVARREVGSFEAFEERVGHWLMSRYDVTGRTLKEQPAAIEAAWRAEQPSPPSSAMLRDKVPPAEREAFDELLLDAQRAFSARDDHATIGALWSLGIIRHALLEAGTRLGIGPDALQLSSAEASAALRGGMPDAGSVARARAVEMERAAQATPPVMLGDPPPPGGPPEMPGPLGRVLAALFTYLESMNGTAQPIGIGTGTARGRAVVALDADDAIDRIQPGDILVTTTTTPAFGAVFPLLGGIVTTTGGPLSHTAIVARELGLPAVVGAADALARIADGVTIELDATTAEVTVV